MIPYGSMFAPILKRVSLFTSECVRLALLLILQMTLLWPAVVVGDPIEKGHTFQGLRLDQVLPGRDRGGGCQLSDVCTLLSE